MNEATRPVDHTAPTADQAAVPYDLIELFFFAYRDFVSDPDRILEKYSFGRAHHRVLHFVNRRPGLTIAALLDNTLHAWLRLEWPGRYHEMRGVLDGACFSQEAAQASGQ